MTYNIPSIIAEVEGFSPMIGHLVAMLQITRLRTIEEVKGLSKDQLDFIYDDKANSVGILLRHIAAIEYWFQVITFENRDLNQQERTYWKGSLTGELVMKLIREKELDYYLHILEETRAKTLSELSQRDDDWLYKVVYSQSNNFYKWYHVMEDEISHRGQIIWIKKRLVR